MQRIHSIRTFENNCRFYKQIVYLLYKYKQNFGTDQNPLEISFTVSIRVIFDSRKHTKFV